jgi:hypothetical protein
VIGHEKSGPPLQVCREAAEVDVLDSIMKRLAPLASSTAQRRWMANGTPDEYLIPEQLLEDALDVTRFAGLRHVRSGLPPSLVSALERLAELVRELSIAGTSNELLVESDPSWAAVREQCRVCLALVDFDLPGWENNAGFSQSTERGAAAKSGGG